MTSSRTSDSLSTYLSDLFSISNSWFLKDKYLLTGVRVNHDFYQATFGAFFFFFKPELFHFLGTLLVLPESVSLKLKFLKHQVFCLQLPALLSLLLFWVDIYLGWYIYSSKNHLHVPFEFNRTYWCLKMPEGNHNAEKGKLTILRTLFLEFQQFISALGLSLSPISKVQVFKILQSTKPQPLYLMPAQEMKYQFTS